MEKVELIMAGIQLGQGCSAIETGMTGIGGRLNASILVLPVQFSLHGCRNIIGTFRLAILSR
jgi:hypothetical protein